MWDGDGEYERVCGIEYLDLDQVGTCSIPSPPEWPPILQVPAPQYRAVRSDHLLSFGDLPNDSCTSTEIRCVQGQHLWRDKSSDINIELYAGYKKGNSEKKINEILAGYDFMNSNVSNYNVMLWGQSPTEVGQGVRRSGRDRGRGRGRGSNNKSNYRNCYFPVHSRWLKEKACPTHILCLTHLFGKLS
ncbi:unnamed protein product [Lactuca saligna]|uniref:Uncharacterized protein n=1 Tax=Lactuca saligna TaxID=75948 RepID=A0AA36DZX6_LACSI|nr:unnamed protein product [Lactuca saligna]